MKDRASGKSRGFGFVTFWNAADAQRVLECAHIVDGRRCEARARRLSRALCSKRACRCGGQPSLVARARARKVWCLSQQRTLLESAVLALDQRMFLTRRTGSPVV